MQKKRSMQIKWEEKNIIVICNVLIDFWYGQQRAEIFVTCSPLVTVAVVFTSCVTTRCSCRFRLCVVVVATVFSSSCCVLAFLPKSSCVVAVRVVTAVAVTYAPAADVSSCGAASAWLVVGFFFSSVKGDLVVFFVCGGVWGEGWIFG